MSELIQRWKRNVFSVRFGALQREGDQDVTELSTRMFQSFRVVKRGIFFPAITPQSLWVLLLS